jgi:pyrroloquinoline quinone (PQQ) biosynthesis protein C
VINAVRVADLLPEDLAKEKTVLEAAALVSRVYDFHRHPYFLWMQAPSTSLEEFRRSQEPYRHYVEHFSQALTAVLARMYPMKQRLSTVFENVVEEHGEGHLHKSHRETFNGYLRAIGCSDSELTASPPPRIAAAYEALLNFCLVNPAEMGAAAVGIV